MITNKLFLTGILLGVSLSANASGDLIKKQAENGVPKPWTGWSRLSATKDFQSLIA